MPECFALRCGRLPALPLHLIRKLFATMRLPAGAVCVIHVHLADKVGTTTRHLEDIRVALSGRYNGLALLAPRKLIILARPIITDMILRPHYVLHLGYKL